MDMFHLYRTWLQSHRGIDAIEGEMQRQLDDALAADQHSARQLDAFARALIDYRHVLLLGMGASHYVNQIFAWQLQKLGIDARARLASEQLAMPLMQDVVLLTSQSGESIETVQCLQQLQGQARLFTLTLTPASTLAQEPGLLLAPGGQEHAYAGTRSVTLSLTMLAHVAARLGAFSPQRLTDGLCWSQKTPLSQLEETVRKLGDARTLIALGRGMWTSLAHLFVLGCQELSQRPSLAYECGQFRHGPMEVLHRGSVIVFFRPGGELGQNVASVLQMQQVSQCQLLVLDSSACEPLAQASTLPLMAGDDIPAALAMLPIVQLLMVGYASRKNPTVGLPRYCSKITTLA